MLKNKIVAYSLSFFCLLFIGILIVRADTTTCEFSNNFTIKYDEAGTVDFDSTYFESKTLPWFVSWFLNINNTQNKIKNTKELEYQPKKLFGSCPEKIYLCLYEEYSSEFGIGNLLSDEHAFLNHIQMVYVFHSKNEMNENSDLKGLTNGEWTGLQNEVWEKMKSLYDMCSDYDTPVLSQLTGLICGSHGGSLLVNPGGLWSSEIVSIKYKDCKELTYQGDLPTYNLSCSRLSSYLEEFNMSIKKYKECSPNDAACFSKTIISINEKEDVIKSYCKTILANYDYDADKEQDCLEACLDIGVQTKKAKIEAGLISNGTGECGFSARLLVWLSNILRWVKYILPVIVIFMGIFDFIKAIAAGKDDELKKAQGKFTKRLIAAALVFLIPLILEFVLNKMGFGYDTCGLF